MYEKHQAHFKALFLNTLALEVGNIPMPEKVKIDVTSDKHQQVTFKMEMIWKGQRMGAGKMFSAHEVPTYKPVPEHEQDGGLLFTLQMLDNPNMLEEHRAYWLFINHVSGEFAHDTAKFFRANWEHVVWMANLVPQIPENYYFEYCELSPKFIPSEIERLIAYWIFPNQEDAFQASLKMRHELEHYRVHMREAYSAELSNGTLSPYAWTPYTHQMQVDHLNYYVVNTLKGKVGNL